MRRLLTVEETFLVSGRGLILWPAPALEEVRGPGDIQVELRFADGAVRTATLSVWHEFFTPPPKVRRWSCVFPAFSKADVPVGTELWCADDVFLAPTSLGTG
jgi:hypothetical protein